METDKKSFLEKLNSKWVTPLFAIIAIVYGFMFKVNNDKLQQNANELDYLSKQIENELRVKEFDNNLKMMIYSEVKEAITKKDSALQNATLIVINEMLKDDTLFREKLKTVLFASSNSKQLIAVQEKIDQFSSEQKDMVKPSASSIGYKIDVFYLDDIVDEAKPRAEKIVKLLEKRYPENTVRLRLLPKEVNAQVGYRISANQIRFEPGESELAKEVLEVIQQNSVFKLEQPVMHEINYYKSPNYISIFVRNM